MHNTYKRILKSLPIIGMIAAIFYLGYIAGNKAAPSSKSKALLQLNDTDLCFFHIIYINLQKGNLNAVRSHVNASIRGCIRNRDALIKANPEIANIDDDNPLLVSILKEAKNGAFKEPDGGPDPVELFEHNRLLLPEQPRTGDHIGPQ